MTLTRRIAHNTFYQTLGRIISTILGLVVFGLLARYLGTDGYGQYSTVIAFIQIFAVVLDLGLYIILIKKISEPDAPVDRYVNNVFTLRFFSAIIFLSLAPVVALFFPYPAPIKIGIAITTFSYLFISLNQVLTGLFQKNLQMNKIAVAEIIGRIALLAATGAVLFFHLNLYAVFGSVIAGSLANFLYVFISAHKFVRLRFTFEWLIWRQVLSESWPIGLSVALNLIYFKADTVILSLYRPAADVGIYGATYKVLEVLVTIPAMFAGLIMPLITAAYVVKDFERFRFIVQRAFDFLAMMALPLIGGTIFIATPLMVLVAGGEFSAAGSVLKILVVATGIIFIGSLFGNAVVAVNRQKPMIWVYLAVAAISLTGYLILIPRYSYYGAAGVTVASETMIMLGSYFMVNHAARLKLRLGKVGKMALATAVMSGALWLSRDLSWLWLVPIGLGVYVICLYLFRVVSKAELKEILSLSR